MANILFEGLNLDTGKKVLAPQEKLSSRLVPTDAAIGIGAAVNEYLDESGDTPVIKARDASAALGHEATAFAVAPAANGQVALVDLGGQIEYPGVLVPGEKYIVGDNGQVEQLTNLNVAARDNHGIQMVGTALSPNVLHTIQEPMVQLMASLEAV